MADHRLTLEPFPGEGPCDATTYVATCSCGDFKMASVYRWKISAYFEEHLEEPVKPGPHLHVWAQHIQDEVCVVCSISRPRSDVRPIISMRKEES